MKKKKESIDWHRFSIEKPILHQKCLVLYRLPKLDRTGTFLASSICIFFATDIHDNKWIPYPNAPAIEFWKPISELPKELQDE